MVALVHDDKRVTLQQEKQNEQTGEQGQTSNGGETLPDHWTEGGGPAPSGQQMVEATKNYDCAAAEKLGKDRLIAKGLTYNENLNRDECTVDSVHFMAVTPISRADRRT